LKQNKKAAENHRLFTFLFFPIADAFAFEVFDDFAAVPFVADFKEYFDADEAERGILIEKSRFNLSQKRAVLFS